MAYRTSKKQSSNGDKLATGLALVAKNPGYSATFTGLLLSSVFGVLGPTEGIRTLSQRTGFLIGGAFIACGVTDRKIGALEAELKRYTEGAAAVSKRASELDLRAKELEGQEKTVRDRLKVEADKRKVKDIAAATRQLERDVERVKSQLKRKEVSEAKAQTELNNLKVAHSAQVAKINAAAAAAQQAAIDAAVLEMKVERDKALSGAAAAQEEAKVARQQLALAQRELEANRGVLNDANAQFNQRSQVIAEKTFEAANGHFEKAFQQVEVEHADTLGRWESDRLEKARLAAENTLLKGPKFCDEESDIGRRAVKLQTIIHGLHEERIDEKGGRHRISAGFLLKFEGKGREGANDVFWFRPCTLTSGSATDIAKYTEKIYQLMGCPGLPIITNDFERQCIKIAIPQGHRTVLAEKDVSRILKAPEAFLKLAARMHRVRITGGSTSGKTPTAELIAYAIKASFNGYADLHFHNPISGSIKAHMTIQQVSSGDDECLAALIQLGQDLKDIGNGQKSRPERFQFHIFDEVDTLIAGNDEVIEAIELIIKRGSHYNVGIALLGQSDAVSIFKGLTHSDMNSLEHIALGENANTWIEKTQLIEKSQSDTLKGKVRLVSDYCNRKNDALKLIADGPTQDPEAFRYALVKVANKPVTFYTVPEFGSMNDVADLGSALENQSHQNRSKISKSSKAEKADSKNAEALSQHPSHNLVEKRAGTAPARAEYGKDCNGRKMLLTSARVKDLREVGAECPDCGKKTFTYKSSRVRKKDSTVQMRCKTKACECGGYFSAQVITD